MHPDSHSGHFNRCLQKHLPSDDNKECLYQLSFPGYSKANLARISFSDYVYAVHEVIASDYRDPAKRDAVRDARDSHKLPPCYYTHPVVTSMCALGPVLALALGLVLKLDTLHSTETTL